MTVRVTTDEVEAIIEVESSIDVTPMITAANLVVTDRLTGAGLGTSLLKEIERWLAAHFVASSRQRQAKSKKMGDATETYYGKDGLNLDSTPYGQQVKILDSSGRMNNIGKMPAQWKTLDSPDYDGD